MCHTYVPEAMDSSLPKVRFLNATCAWWMCVLVCCHEASPFHYVVFHQRSQAYIVLRQCGEYEKVPGAWQTAEEAA